MKRQQRPTYSSEKSHMARFAVPRSRPGLAHLVPHPHPKQKLKKEVRGDCLKNQIHAWECGWAGFRFLWCSRSLGAPCPPGPVPRPTSCRRLHAGGAPKRKSYPAPAPQARVCLPTPGQGPGWPSASSAKPGAWKVAPAPRSASRRDESPRLKQTRRGHVHIQGSNVRK